MKSAVVVFPGINRERDMARTLRLVSGQAPAMVWHADTVLPAGTDLVVVPGGFSYGDYLRCGAIAARAPIMDAVRGFAAKGGLVLGVCNGFQILCEAGLLPGVLMRNAQLKFICKDVHLKVERSGTPFTRGYNAGQVIRVPVAHGEGNFVADADTIARIEGEGRVVFRYCAPDGTLSPASNLNGSTNAIAGIVNERGNVLGMMPHPENHVEAAIDRRTRPVRGARGASAGGVVRPTARACFFLWKSGGFALRGVGSYVLLRIPMRSSTHKARTVGEAKRAHAAAYRVGTAQARLCPPYGRLHASSVRLRTSSR
jgi:phosphoribosylformylglycinamidine synthase I